MAVDPSQTSACRRETVVNRRNVHFPACYGILTRDSSVLAVEDCDLLCVQNMYVDRRKVIKKNCGLGPRANYTARATAAFRRS
jgi:hypothetical protein